MGKVLVLGDAMLDKHTKGSVTRLSPEAPVPVVDAGPISEFSLGAAANVAAQIAAADIECFFSYKEYTDSTDSHMKLHQMCREAEIKSYPLHYPDIVHPVTTKERIWANGQQVCRIDRENKARPNGELESKWLMDIKALISNREINCVVLSDYDKGTLSDRFIQAIADYCYEKKITTILDPKRFSFWGLQHLTLIKPNEKEIAITNMPASKVSVELGNTYLLNTLGEKGMDMWHEGNHLLNVQSVKGNDVVDVCGCGDTVTAFIAIGLVKGKKILETMKVANIAASINIQHKGCFVLDNNLVEAVFNPTYQLLHGGG